MIVPPLAAFLTIPGFTEIIRRTDSNVIGTTYLFGLLWGIGGLTYGLGVRYLGVSLGSSIILGLCMVFGALIVLFLIVSGEFTGHPLRPGLAVIWGVGLGFSGFVAVEIFADRVIRMLRAMMGGQDD